MLMDVDPFWGFLAMFGLPRAPRIPNNRLWGLEIGEGGRGWDPSWRLKNGDTTTHNREAVVALSMHRSRRAAI